MLGSMTIAALLLGGLANQTSPMPAWMAGAWCTEGPESDRTCEYWTPETGGLMLGGSITTRGGKLREFEQIRISLVEGVAVYFASPGGQPAIQFRAAEGAGQSITFTKPDHDYPQRIRYTLEDDTLTAEISLADGSKPMRWKYRRVG